MQKDSFAHFFKRMSMPYVPGRGARRSRGFTMVEILLAIAIIGLMITIAAISQRGAQLKARDVKRVSDMKQLEKALTFHLSVNNSFPVYSGCIDESAGDLVTSALRSGNVINVNANLKDPAFPADITKCYFYNGTASSYTIRYTLETNSQAGAAGDHIIQP